MPKGSNPRSLENLKKNPFARLGEQPLAKKALATKVPADIDATVRAFPNYSAWVREAIIEKLERQSGSTDKGFIAPDNPLVVEAIAKSLAQKRKDLTGLQRKRKPSKEEKAIVKRLKKEIEQLEELL